MSAARNIFFFSHSGGARRRCSLTTTWMEGGGKLVSCRQDISAIVNEQTAGDKHKVRLLYGGLALPAGWFVRRSLLNAPSLTAPLPGSPHALLLCEVRARRRQLFLQGAVLRPPRVHARRCQSAAEVTDQYSQTPPSNPAADTQANT